MYNHTKELAKKRDQQQQSQDSKDNKDHPPLGEIERLNMEGNDDDDDKEEEETGADSEWSEKSGGEEGDDDECANFIRGIINSHPSTQAVREESHIFNRKKSANRSPRHNRANKRPILGTRG